MNFPKLSSVRLLTDEEMQVFTGGSCMFGCKKGCISGCKSSCKPGNSNVGSGNDIEIK